MSWFSRLYAALTQGSPAPRLEAGGHPLWWDWSQWRRLPVLMDGGSDETTAAAFFACSVLNSLSETGLLFRPEPLIREARDIFFASRDTYQGAIVVQPYVMTETPGTWFRCTSDLRYDKRTGEMRNVLVEWNLQPGDYAGNQNRLLHELGHCLGLAHCDGTIMQEAREDWGASPGFSKQQLAFLKSLKR